VLDLTALTQSPSLHLIECEQGAVLFVAQLLTTPCHGTLFINPHSLPPPLQVSAHDVVVVVLPASSQGGAAAATAATAAGTATIIRKGASHGGKEQASNGGAPLPDPEPVAA
jgi:hypothetical protein